MSLASAEVRVNVEGFSELGDSLSAEEDFVAVYVSEIEVHGRVIISNRPPIAIAVRVSRRSTRYG